MKAPISKLLGPHKNSLLIGIQDSNSWEFFLGDYTHLPTNPIILAGKLDPVDRIFYPDSSTLELVENVVNNKLILLLNQNLP